MACDPHGFGGETELWRMLELFAQFYLTLVSLFFPPPVLLSSST